MIGRLLVSASGSCVPNMAQHIEILAFRKKMKNSEFEVAEKIAAVVCFSHRQRIDSA